MTRKANLKLNYLQNLLTNSWQHSYFLFPIYGRIA